MSASVADAEAVQATPARAGVILQANEGQRIPPTADGRRITVKIDSHSTAGVRMGSGIATLGDREIPGAII